MKTPLLDGVTKLSIHINQPEFDKWLHGAGEAERNVYINRAKSSKEALNKLNRKAREAGAGRVFHKSKASYYTDKGLRAFKNIGNKLKGKLSSGLNRFARMKHSGDIVAGASLLALYLGSGLLGNAITRKRKKMRKAASLLCEMDKESSFKDIIGKLRGFNPLRQAGKSVGEGVKEGLKISPKALVIGGAAGLSGIALRDYINNRMTASMLAKEIQKVNQE